MITDLELQQDFCEYANEVADELLDVGCLFCDGDIFDPLSDGILNPHKDFVVTFRNYKFNLKEILYRENNAL